MGAVAAFLRAHWQSLCLVLVVAVGYGWVRHLQAVNVAAIAQINVAHQAEVDAINQARADEAAQHQQEQLQLQQSLAQIQQQFDQAQAALAAQQAKEQQQIIVQYGNDPAGLATLVASKFGLTVVGAP